ncbi:MAG: NADH-quinone oxidoreductase subunit M [Candidatus Micrarchaeaceae archaeon]
MFPLLLFIVAIPFLSILLLIVLPERLSKKIQQISSIIILILSLLLVYSFSTSTQSLIQPITFNYLGFTGSFQVTSITLILELMCAIVFTSSSIGIDYFIKDNIRIYSILFALIQGSAIALFLSSNLLLLYVFWEIAEFSMFFIIYLYGASNRKYAAIKFIIYSLISSLFLLIAILLIYVNVTPSTFQISQIITNASTMPTFIQEIVLLFLVISFMIKIPIFPFHNWLPDAHTEAPTTGSMILAGILLKFGGYGLILTSLMLPIFSKYSLYLAGIFILSSFYSVFVAIKQTNLKKLIAYSSITDMAIVSLGIVSNSTLGINGALYGMLGHAISISMLFLLAGTLKEIYGSLDLSVLKGIMKDYASLAYLFIIGVFATVGIPLTVGFIGDILIFSAAFSSFGIIGLLPLLSIIILGSVMFWVIERVFLNGRSSPNGYLVKSVFYSEIFLLFFSLLLGIAPFILIH